MPSICRVTLGFWRNFTESFEPETVFTITGGEADTEQAFQLINARREVLVFFLLVSLKNFS